MPSVSLEGHASDLLLDCDISWFGGDLVRAFAGSLVVIGSFAALGAPTWTFSPTANAPVKDPRALPRHRRRLLAAYQCRPICEAHAESGCLPASTRRRGSGQWLTSVRTNTDGPQSRGRARLRYSWSPLASRELPRCVPHL